MEQFMKHKETKTTLRQKPKRKEFKWLVLFRLLFY